MVCISWKTIIIFVAQLAYERSNSYKTILFYSLSSLLLLINQRQMLLSLITYQHLVEYVIQRQAWISAVGTIEIRTISLLGSQMLYCFHHWHMKSYDSDCQVCQQGSVMFKETRSYHFSNVPGYCNFKNYVNSQTAGKNWSRKHGSMWAFSKWRNNFHSSANPFVTMFTLHLDAQNVFAPLVAHEQSNSIRCVTFIAPYTLEWIMMRNTDYNVHSVNRLLSNNLTRVPFVF